VTKWEVNMLFIFICLNMTYISLQVEKNTFKGGN